MARMATRGAVKQRTDERAQLDELAHLSGQLIRKQRELKELTQVELAERLGVGQGTVSKWEKGLRLPRDYWRMRLAEELGTTVPHLFPIVNGLGARKTA